jgi:hypothetical protein
MQRSISQLSYDQLIQYKLKLHHLQRDYGHDAESLTDPSKLHRVYRTLSRLESVLKTVYAEMERRKPGDNIYS